MLLAIWLVCKSTTVLFGENCALLIGLVTHFIVNLLLFNDIGNKLSFKLRYWWLWEDNVDCDDHIGLVLIYYGSYLTEKKKKNLSFRSHGYFFFHMVSPYVSKIYPTIKLICRNGEGKQNEPKKNKTKQNKTKMKKKKSSFNGPRSIKQSVRLKMSAVHKLCL